MRSPLRAAAAASLLAVLTMLAPVSPLEGGSSGAGSGAAYGADSSALLTWNHLTPTVAPPSRLHAAMAFDAATGTTVLFGGRSGSQALGDTWTWDGSIWTAHNPPASPPPLESASMAYDNIGHRILLFGGVAGDGNPTNGTWSWDGTTWAALPATSGASGPPARYGASMAADLSTGTDVLFGGLSVTGTALNDTWTWDGATWAAKPVASPPPRSGAAMTFDAIRGVVVLFGGANGTDNRADTWTWDGTGWTQQSPGSSPPARTEAVLGFDAGTQSAVLFGGRAGDAVLDDTWLWNGSTWSTSLPLTLLPHLRPPARAGATIATAPGSQRLVLFGGQSTGSSALDDTWSVATVITGPPPTTAPTTVKPAGGPTTTVAGATTSSTADTARAPTTTRPPATATTRGPADRAPLNVTSSSVHQGQQVTVSGSGFVPGSEITITFHSVRVVVGRTHADQNGRFRATVLVPADAPPGPHHIEADGAAPTGGKAVLVAQVSIMAPGSHPAWLLPGLMVALTVLLAAGAGVVLTASTRWHRRPLGD